MSQDENQEDGENLEAQYEALMACEVRGTMFVDEGFLRKMRL